MAFEIASGVKALHAFDPPVVHRDLKSGNILVPNLFIIFPDKAIIFPNKEIRVLIILIF